MIFCNANIGNEFQLELYFVYDSKYITVELSIPKGGRKQKEIDKSKTDLCDIHT